MNILSKIDEIQRLVSEGAEPNQIRLKLLTLHTECQSLLQENNELKTRNKNLQESETRQRVTFRTLMSQATQAFKIGAS